MNQALLIDLLKKEILPTMGCTEPGAVALAAAYAREALKEEAVKKIKVTVNANVYKNGVAVGIPGTGETGFFIAAALGVIKGHPERQLAVLADVLPQELEKAREMVAQNIIEVQVDEEKESLWIQVRLETDRGWSQAVIAEKHTQVISIQRNGEELFSQGSLQEGEGLDHRQVLKGDDLRIVHLVEAVEAMPLEQLEFLFAGVEMNLLAAKAGIEKRLGMGIGAVYDEMVDNGLMSKDLVNYAKILTAAAADARMSGESVAVMSSAGSGNHGITVILPVYAVADKLGAPREKLLRAVALSHLITVYIKIYTGSLSALCGCAVAAATGATAAITWLMGGQITQMEAAMKNLIANLTGMICDGGKVGCALKLSTAAATAVESSLLAQKNIVVPDTNGIIADGIEQTIRNLGKISNPGMIVTDKVILDVMLEKQAQ